MQHLGRISPLQGEKNCWKENKHFIFEKISPLKFVARVCLCNVEKEKNPWKHFLEVGRGWRSFALKEKLHGTECICIVQRKKWVPTSTKIYIRIWLPQENGWRIPYDITFSFDLRKNDFPSPGAKDSLIPRGEGGGL